MMFTKMQDVVKRNRKLIILTIEIFWIVIFLLDRVANEASDIPEFVYVNF